MYIGRYYHTLETKGRVSIPAKFREALGAVPVLSRGLDGGLFLFSHSDWERFAQSLQVANGARKVDRDYIRLMLHDAVEVEVDELGRIVVPEYLRAAINLKKNVVFAGSYDRVELWDRESYHTYLESLEDSAASVAEHFADVHLSASAPAESKDVSRERV